MEKQPPVVRTRFAPSPTGFLHIGSLRTALYSWLLARQHGGQFILRLEDTDLKRYVPGAASAIYNGLKWAGLNYDEGPDIEGPYGPYVQSQRLEIYKKHAHELVEKGLAYYCFCDEATLEKIRQEQIAAKKAPKYDRRCLNLKKTDVEKKLKENTPHVIRMKIPENRKIEFYDLVRGKMSYNSGEIDDQILLKSDGYPTYHLAVVVDDHLMNISHVTRTEEWLPSTPKHILLYEFFGWEAPQWAHLPLLLNADKTKMSKRKGDVTLENYIKKGYLPEAMINFLAFLGWNPGTEKEIYSIDELIKDFSLNKVHKAGAVFNAEKLNWLNSYYIKQIEPDKLTEICIPYLEEADLIKKNGSEWEIADGIKKDLKWIKKIAALEKDRLEFLAQIGENAKFFFKLPAYEKELLIWKETPAEKIKESLEKVKTIISEINEKDFSKEKIQEIIMPEAEKIGNRGAMLWPLRVALSGQKNSPGPFEIAEILGKDESKKRIEKAIEKIV
ncbi:MAG: glutamate--tRNA ligase [Candidatus Portnoybacteria bacterium]|nr:glutamate--tRNA ligase [Candidatus Portnoybacteria bacterium]